MQLDTLSVRDSSIPTAPPSAECTRPAPWAALALTLALAAPARADSDEACARAYLEAAHVAAGSTAAIKLRTTAPDGSLAYVLYASEAGALVLPNPNIPVLRLDFTTLALGTSGTVSDGALGWSAPIPRAWPLDQGLHLQGLVFTTTGPEVLIASNAVRIDPNPSSTAPSFSNGTSMLAADASLLTTTDVDWADIDRDGFLDVVCAHSGHEIPLVQFNEGGHAFTSGVLPRVAAIPQSVIELGDVNGDKYPDLFIGAGTDESGPLANLLLLNDGTGDFVHDPTFPGGAGHCIDAELGDVDRDGDLDLVVANVQDADNPGETSDPVVLYLNQGGLQAGTLGEFVEDTAFTEIPGNGTHGSNGDVTLGDVDNDGDLDLFIASADPSGPGAQNLLYVNDGSGGFTDVTATALPAGMDNSQEAAMADVDGDGRLDIFVTNSVSTVPSAVHLLLNTTTTPGAPTFADGSANVPASFGEVTSVRLAQDLGDIDGDGDPDVIVTIHELPGATGNDGETVLLVNQGGLQGGTPGVFVVDTSFDPFGLFIGSDASFADFDGDGDLDLYIANSGNLFEFDFQDILLVNEL